MIAVSSQYAVAESEKVELLIVNQLSTCAMLLLGLFHPARLLTLLTKLLQKAGCLPDLLCVACEADLLQQVGSVALWLQHTSSMLYNAKHGVQGQMRSKTMSSQHSASQHATRGTAYGACKDQRDTTVT